MKLICYKEHQEELNRILERYQDLDIVLVEQGLTYEGLSYQFHYDFLDELLSYLETLKNKTSLVGYQKGRMYPLLIDDIVYIEGFSRECYIHTIDEEYESQYKLFEIESILEGTSLIRISKSIIVNINHIHYILPETNMRYGIYMRSHVKLILSRKYLKDFKKKIGMR